MNFSKGDLLVRHYGGLRTDCALGVDAISITGALEEVRHPVIRNGLAKGVLTPFHLFPVIFSYTILIVYT